MKTTMLAVVVALMLGACGPSDGHWNPSAAAAQADADSWAEQAFSIYGEDAVRSCLAGFHAEYEWHAQANGNDYREALVNFLCECARGQSTQPCPQP